MRPAKRKRDSAQPQEKGEASREARARQGEASREARARQGEASIEGADGVVRTAKCLGGTEYALNRVIIRVVCILTESCLYPD